MYYNLCCVGCSKCRHTDSGHMQSRQLVPTHSKTQPASATPLLKTLWRQLLRPFGGNWWRCIVIYAVSPRDKTVSS